jgi:arabinogalactan endo-1,4-beta-galactosidase
MKTRTWAMVVMLTSAAWAGGTLQRRSAAAPVTASPAAATSQPAAEQPPTAVARQLPYMVGADISWVQQREDAGAKYSDKGETKDILAILKDHGFNYIRLRVFNDPTKRTPVDRPYAPQGYCDVPHTIAMGKRVKAAGMGLLINFHYSDSWADPQKQYAPSAWADLTPEQTATALHDWTKKAIQQMKDGGAKPDMVQVGNEITPGMMMDKGGSTRNWPQLAAYLKAGIGAVREVDPNIAIMLHIDKGGDNRATREWVDAALAQGLQFDVLGLSCYARWHGPPEGWKANFEDLAKRYPQLRLVMAEVDAQAEVANDIMKGLPGERGLGTFIWEPEADNANQTLFVQPSFGGRRGAGGVVAPATTAAATSPAATGPAVPTAPAGVRGARGGGGVMAVDPARMGAYDKVVEKYGLKKLP